ncbi:MAG TPA: aldehyde dehydrogenase (NADP(+)) [Terriglobales bacterium]|nr:aldehyde dehydrogenase (NADP(+)) [Terriglobales bacterium]
MAKLTGRSIVGFADGDEVAERFYGINPANGQRLQPGYSPAKAADVEHAAQLAAEAFRIYGRTSGRERGALLRAIAANIESLTSELVERAHQETALPPGRLEAETARTCGQLRLFAQVAEEGSWVGARIDRADPDRKPAAKPDLRSMLRPLGPVAVFGASNFPLAFSVAGGDTASAFASGNPVIVKAHPAHPGTSDLVGQAIRSSVRECGLPAGVFSLLFDSGTQVGVALVTHPLIKAVGFTGSRSAGRVLMDLAAARPEPIPFFGEMSSTNPMFVLPGALRERGEAIATGLHASFTLGAGQFCTKPGIVFVPQGVDARSLAKKLQELVLGSTSFHLLTPGIRSSYLSAVAGRRVNARVKSVTEAPAAETGLSVGSVLFETDAASFSNSFQLEGEIFGPTTLLVQHSSRSELLEIANKLEGHLTATIHGTDEDLRDFGDLVAILENKVGRVIFNGFPTGVEVSHAMVHGGPYPATSDGRFTSVGSQAIFRFARPVCYQGFPDHALPEELKDSNPLRIWRMIEGEMTREANLPALVSESR